MKPAQAPTKAAMAIATCISDTSREITSTVVAEMVLTPTASPSSPSIRLTELVMATIHSTVMTTELTFPICQ